MCIVFGLVESLSILHVYGQGPGVFLGGLAASGGGRSDVIWVCEVQSSGQHVRQARDIGEVKVET